MLAMVFCLTSGVYAWIVSVKNTSSVTFQSASLVFTWNGAFVDNQTNIVPGDNLIKDKLKIINTSTTDSELRIKITYDAFDSEGKKTIVFDDMSSLNYLVGEMGQDFVYEDGYWYYENSSTSPSTRILDTPVENDPQVLDIMSILYYNGNYCGSSFQLEKCTISFTFEAKQARNVTWIDIGEIQYNLNV